MSDSVDMELEAILASAVEDDSHPTQIDTNTKEFSVDSIPTNRKSLFTKSVDEVVNHKKEKNIHEADLSQKCFDPVEKLVNDTPSPVFSDPSYYKTALTGENQSAQRVHQVLSKYLTSQDPKDRAVYRQQIVTAYWELLRGMVGKMSNPSAPMPKRMLVRFGVLLPSLFKAETKEFFSKIIFDNNANEFLDVENKKLTGTFNASKFGGNGSYSVVFEKVYD